MLTVNMVYCITLDPGGTTGVCIVHKETEPWRMHMLQLGPHAHHKELLSLLTRIAPNLLIVEEWDNRSQDAARLASIEYIGVAKAYAQASGCAYIGQSASTGKWFWNDNKLREHGLYVPKLRHARDACRHYLYYRTFTLHDTSLLSRNATGTIST